MNYGNNIEKMPNTPPSSSSDGDSRYSINDENDDTSFSSPMPSSVSTVDSQFTSPLSPQSQSSEKKGNKFSQYDLIFIFKNLMLETRMMVIQETYHLSHFLKSRLVVVVFFV